MDTARFVAALIGPIYIVVGIGIVLDPKYYMRMVEEFLRSPALIYLGGAMAMGAGLSIVYFHNVWSTEWPVVITILGWLACLKGAHLLAFPGHASQLWTPIVSRPNWLRIAALPIIAFGIFLSLEGYGGI